MTSTNDGKDVKSNQTSGHKGKSYYIDLYKSLEKHLGEECELRERTQHLCEAWRRVHSLCQHSAPTTHPHYLAWLQRHTANTLLQSEWQSEKDEHKKLEDAINSFIAESNAAVANRNGHSPAWESQLLQRGEWFKSILGNPWGHPVLKVLCDPRGKPPTDEEILEWLKEERGVIFVTRLRHLAASRKCHEIALSLASAVMDRARASEVLVPDAEQADDQEPPRPEGSKPTFKDVLRSEAGFTVDVWELITDLELVLLHKRDEHAQCIALAKKIPLRSGYQLVERLRSRPETSPREKKLWKNAGEVATLVAQVLITRCMVVPWCGGVVRSALYCCARSLVRLVAGARLPAAARALAAPAATARHLHTLAAAVHTQLHAQHAQDMNSFVCELYVRAITAGMNELEKLKIKTEKEAEARGMEQTLAAWFTSLGALLQASARIQCECALTAFSVHPSPAMYDRIQAAPPLPTVHVESQEPKEETKSEFGSWANDSRGQTNLVKTSETLKLKQTQQHTNVMSTAIFAEGEAIGLSAELCQDLTVCLSGPRVKTLSWDMDREVLLENCQKYMARTHGGTRALTTELKYLNLDPSQYQHLPEEEEDENDVYYGIEKGYEHLVELQEEATWEDPFQEDTETAYSSCIEDNVPVRRKKTAKRLPLSSEDESDPLCTLADKKERPHSKERSKDRKKKSKDPEKAKEKQDSKEKKKRERKKPPIGKPGSLASLIGVKIAIANEVVTDSDYDSQGKSSQASEGNDQNVIYDGLFSMDHKDKVNPLSDKTTNEVTNVVAVNKPKRKPSVNKRKPKVNPNVPADGKPPVLPVRNMNSLLKPDLKPRPSTVGVVSDQIKRSITKLLQFRRNQNAGLLNKTTPKPDNKPANAIYKPDFPVQPFVSPKSVVVPEIPKSYINKATIDKFNINRSPPASNYAEVNEFMGPPPLNRFDNTSPNSANEVMQPSSKNSAANTSRSVNYKDIMSVQNYYQINILGRQTQVSRSIVNDHSRVQPNNISLSLTRVEPSRAHVSEHEKSYENFLKELNSSINAGTGSNPSPSPTAPTGVVIKKDCKPPIRGSPLIPSSSNSDLSPQCAKQVLQKKVENAPNTFSRLSYMHKNKQSDMKQALETQANRQVERNKQTAASLDLSRCLAEFKNTKIKYIQTMGETVITRVDNPLNLSCDNAVRKAEKSPPTSRNNPIIRSMLQANKTQSPVTRNNNVTTNQVTSPPGTSYLSEKDQNDLVLLLQQRNRINATGTVPRIGNLSQNAPINMTTTSNKPVSTALSKPIQSSILLNNNVKQYETQESKTGQLEPNLNTVINYAKTETQKQERAKKAVTSGRKKRTKLDWESVMNAIRAQKTPSRGPSALELALNIDSSDNSLRNQRIVRTNSVGQLDKVQAAIEAVIKHTNNVKPITSLDLPILTPTTNDEIKNQYNTQFDIQNKPVQIKKAVKNVTPKKVSGGVDKKQTIKNKFAVSVSNNKDVDPFIHGRDDDYNLSDLDDLLDDELRRELGELSSDEDAYRIPQAQKGIKTTCSKSNITSKQGVSSKEKDPEVKYATNVAVSSSDQPRPTEEMRVLDGQYPKSRETSAVRSQANKKQKSSAQTCLLNQTINTAPSNENENKNKNVLRTEKPQQGTDVSSRQSTASHTMKKVNKEKVLNSTLNYKYLNTVHSNATVDKNTLKRTAENQPTAPDLHSQYAGPSNTNVSTNVYVIENEPVIQVAVPAANVVLFGSDMYYNPNIQTQLEPRICTINQTIVQQTAPNIALYQTANFAAPVLQQASFIAPVVTPLVLDNTMNVPATTSTSVTVTTHETTDAPSQPYFNITPPNQCKDEPQMVNNKEPIVIKECPVTGHTDVPLINTTSNDCNKVNNKQPIVTKECPIPRHTDVTLINTTSNDCNKVNNKQPIVTKECPIPSHADVTLINTTSNEYNKVNKQPNVTKECPIPRHTDVPLIKTTCNDYNKVNNKQSIVIKECPIPRHTDVTLINTSSNDHNNKATLDINSNKNSERRSSLDVQENQKHEASKSPRSRAVSNEEVSRDILNDQEKEQTITSNVLKNLINDLREPYSLEDTERPKRKRLAILNRQIIQNSVHPTIALSYSPILKKSHVDVCEKISGRLNDTNKEMVSQEIIPVLEEGESIDQTMVNVINLITQEANDTALFETDDREKQPNDDSKENTSGTVQCRRISLRSSVKNLPKIPNSASDQNPVGRKTKVRLKATKAISKTDMNKPADDSNKKTKTTKKIARRKIAASTNKKSSSAPANDVPPVQEKSTESISDELFKNMTEPLISENFDVEEALLGAKIPNTIVADPLTISLDPPKTVVNKESQVNAKKLDKVAVIEDRKVTSRRKRKSVKIVDNSSDLIEHNDNKIEGNRQLPTDGFTLENKIKNIVTKKRQSTRNSLLKSSITQPEQLKIVINNGTDKKLSSQLEGSHDEMKVKAGAKNIVVPDKEIMNISSGKKNQPTITAVEKIANKTFQNVFESAAVSSNNVQKPSKITNISKTIADLIEQINNGDVLGDHKTNNIKEKVASPITITGNKRVQTMPETGAKKPVLTSNVSKKLDENPASTCVDEHNRIPQSYKDSVIIEEIPNTKAAGNVSKLLRVKLPNGKVYKASVYGKMHTSFDSLFDDPALRAMLMSNFNEQMKYTLNIKQISTPNKENPDKPIDTRIQEIHVKSSSLKPAVVETINLLSDDEESDDNCSFKTKCGVYKTTLKDKQVIAKHQAKFDRGCSVTLKRLIIPEKDVAPLDELQPSDVIEIDEDSDCDNLDETLPPVVPDTTNEITEETPSTKPSADEVIEIDESSNDSIDLLKSCPNLPVALIGDVPIKSTVSESEGDTINSPEVITEQKTGKYDLQPGNSEKCQIEYYTEALLSNKSQEESLNCYVPLSKCDDLVEEYKYAEEAECSGPKEELDLSFDTSDAEMSSNASVSILSDFALHSDKNHEQLSDDGRSSPVIGIFEVIASLHKKYKADQIKMAEAKCESEWLRTKRQICHENNVIEKQTLHSNKTQIQKYSEDGRSSPVIGVFEVIASLHSKYIAKKETEIVYYGTKCRCEWLATKSQMRQDYNFIDMQINLNNDKRKSQQIDASSGNLPTNLVSSISIPSLLSILTAFFRNSSVVNHLKPLPKNGNTQRIKRRKSSVSNLKRKIQNPDNIIASKMSKNELVDCEKLSIKGHVAYCDDRNNMNVLGLSNDSLKGESQIQKNCLECSDGPVFASNEIQKNPESVEICAIHIMTDNTKETELKSENNVNHNNIDANSGDCDSHQTDDRMDCEESKNDIYDNNAEFMASESLTQSEDKITIDDVVLQPIQNQQLKETTGMQDDTIVSDTSLSFEERHATESETEQKIVDPDILFSQNGLVSNVTNTEDIQKDNIIDLNIISNTVQLLTEENMLPEEKDGNVKHVTIVNVNDKENNILGKDIQSDVSNEINGVLNEDADLKDTVPLYEIKTTTDEVFDRQTFVEAEIVSNKVQKYNTVNKTSDTERVQNDNSNISSDNNKIQFENKTGTDDICDRQAVLDIVSTQDQELSGVGNVLNKDTVQTQVEKKIAMEVDEAEQCVQGTVILSEHQQNEKTTDTDLQNCHISTCSGYDVYSQIEDKLAQRADEVEQIEECISLSSPSNELGNSIRMENVSNENCKSINIVSNTLESQIEENVTNVCCNERVEDITATEDVHNVSIISIIATSGYVKSQFEEKVITAIVGEQDIVEVDAVTSMNDQINYTTEVTSAHNGSSLPIDSKQRCDVSEEKCTREEGIDKEIIDSEILEHINDIADAGDLQYVNIVTGDSGSDIQKSEDVGYKQVYDITVIPDEMKMKDIEEAKIVTSPSHEEIMDTESLQNDSVIPNNKGDKIENNDTVEIRSTNLQNILEQGIISENNIETTMDGRLVDEIVEMGYLEDVNRQAENVINLDISSSSTTGEEYGKEKLIGDIPKMDKTFGSEGDDETITIIEVKDESSVTKVDMNIEILAEREELDSLFPVTKVEQIAVDTANENIKLAPCDTTAGFASKSDETISDSTTDLKDDHFVNDSCIGVEVICGDTTSHDNDHIELPVGDYKVKGATCEEIITKKQRKIDDNVQEDINDKHTVPDHGYTYLHQVSHDVATETEPSNEREIDEANVSETLAEQDVVDHENDSQDCLLRGIEFQDPEVGTLYVLYPIEDSGSDTATLNDSCDDTPETLEDIVVEVANNSSVSISDDETLQVKIPKITYSKQVEEDLGLKKNLKRKMDTDSKYTTKKYRKGKNIDYPKLTAAAINEQGYTKEYKRVFDYSSSLKFSYTQPFHKDYLDVDETIKDWPIKGPCRVQPDFIAEPDFNIFTDTETSNYQPLPMEQSLEDELNQDYSEISELSSDINETNFNMGFGEGSGRVIQNLEDVDDISKVSAATLSDVKQPQPFLQSEHCKEKGNKEHASNDQLEKIQRYLTYIKLREKVKSFFQKSTIELKCDSLNQKKKELVNNENLDSTSFPFDFYIGDFKEPPLFEPIVQVVQVGQLPVSAAAQNPVTCDPRVTQVSDASPSQCSVDNSPQDDSSTLIKTEYTELTTADFTLPLVQEYVQHNQTMPMESHENPNLPMSGENIPIETEIKSVVKIELEELEEKEEPPDLPENTDTESMAVNHNDYSYEANNTAPEMNMSEIKYEPEDPPQTRYGDNNTTASLEQDNTQMMFNSTEDKKNIQSEEISQQKQNGALEKTDQIAHAMSAAGITTTTETLANNRAQALVNIINQKIRQGSGCVNTHTTANNYSKTTSINAMALQQALAQILPPPLNQTNATDNNQQTTNTQVLHIVQGKNASGSQITLVDNSQQSVISGTNATPVLHIVQNKSGTPGVTANGAPGTQNNSFSGLSLVDAGLQQGGNQLLHIVNTGNQKNNNAGQLLKRVNLLTNLANVQGSNEQKMVQFVCKSADGKSIQLNAPHQRSMVLRLQPIESPAPTAQAKPAENQDPNQSPSAVNNKDAASQQEIKSRSVYEENYAKFIQNSGTKPAAAAEKSTSLPKFNQAFGKPVFQDGTQKPNDMNSNNVPAVNTPTENNECPPSENTINLEHIGQISSPPLLLRKSPAQTSQAQTNLVQQIKQTIAPMNIQTMHGGVIYTRQIPVNIGGGQTINLITVPSTELIDESGQKQQSTNQGEIEPSIIKIVPQTQSTNNSEMTEDGNANMATSNENTQNPQPQTQPQPVLTQMRIKLPMLSKTPQMVGGARVVRPSFFQIQRNVIGGANQPVYQQLVLTAAPPLGQQTIRLPAANRTQPKVPTENQSSTESMSSSTLEQLREFDMVLEQVKERSTVQPNSTITFPKLHTPSSDTTDNAVSAPATTMEQTQVLYSIGNNQQLNVAYVNRKATVTTPTTSNFVRSPDSCGVADSPTSSTHVRTSHTVASETTPNEVALNQSKPAKLGSKSKSRPKSSSHTHNTLTKINPVPAKTSTQKPLEDEQTTQRILYILAEYKEQVENSPDKDKPAPRRRSNPPSNPGSSKRKKSSSGSRRICGRDMSPVHGDETCRTMGSEDSSCGTSQGDCNENCLESNSPQDSPRKIVRKLTYEPENAVQQPRPQPQRNVIVADGQTITVARGTAGKPATAVLMPANYILPVSMVKGGQQIAIVTNRGPKLLTVGGGEGGATNALLLQRLIGPGGLKPVLARPGVRHVRLPTAALHNLQAFNLATATTVQPPDSTASPAPAPTPPDLVETRATSSPWTNRESEDAKPERGSSPEGSEPWNLPSSADPHDYTYEETVRADNMDRTVLDPIPDRYSPDMEAQRIFDKMFDVDSKKSYIVDSPRCGYDIDASDCDDKPYHQVVHKKDGTSQRHHRLTHVSAAALRHKYAILEHELRLQKSLSEECEDLGVDSPSASELFPEAELLFAASPAHDHTQDQGQQSHTPQPTILNQSSIPQPDIDDQIATDQLLPREDMDRQQLELGLEDVGIVSVGAHGMQAVALDHEEFARAHPNTTFHTDEPTNDSPVPPFAIAGLKGRHITSTIFHSNRPPATVLMTAPQTTVISQASAEPAQNVKYADIDNMINTLPSSHNNINLSSVLVKDDGLTRFDNLLNDTRELHLTNTASAIVHSTGNATQVIRRVCYDDKRERDASFLMDEPDAIIAGDDAKMVAEDSSRDATLESMADVDDDRSSPERHAELFWESNSASERSESRRPLDFSSDSDKCCKSPSYDETNSTDSSGVGTHMRLDSVIKDARGIERSGSADGSSADDTHPPLRTYPPKRMYHPLDGEMERSLSGKTRAGERSPDSLEVRRRASGRGVVKRGCHCCNGSPAPPRPKKSRQKKPTMDFTTN